MTGSPTRVLIGTAVWNEGEKFERLAQKMADFLERQEANPQAIYKFLVVDDGSDDGTVEKARDIYSFLWHRHEKNQGAGASVRSIYRIAREQGFQIAVTIAGHGKDDPFEIPLLVEPVLQGESDFVQGSRYLPGGQYKGMPAYRVIATRHLHPKLLSWSTGQKITDSTNGFRAIRLSILDDARINLDQDWLDRYEMEPYLLYQAIKCGYRVREAAVKKIYPDAEAGYTKIKPISGWWSILRPLILLYLGIRK